jgi:hypothetical protein
MRPQPKVQRAEAPVAAAAANAPQSATMPSATELYEMICEAAYYRAEKRGFTPGLEAEDWLHAEAEVLERVRALRNGNGKGSGG